jgi:glycosyltransferase involved in cell wall biosynthesis
MGRVLLEAMAAAKPIIGTRVGGIPHYVHDGENGFLVTPGSVDELSTRMLEVLQDPALARRLGDRGRQLAMSKYDEQAFVRHFAEMFTRMGFGVPSPHEPRHASAERQYV